MLPSAEMLSMTVIPSAVYKVAYLIKKNLSGIFVALMLWCLAEYTNKWFVRKTVFCVFVNNSFFSMLGTSSKNFVFKRHLYLGERPWYLCHHNSASFVWSELAEIFELWSKLSVATMPALVFVAPLLLFACYNVSRFVASSSRLVPLLYFLDLTVFSDVYGEEIKDISSTTV